MKIKKTIMINEKNDNNLKEVAKILNEKQSDLINKILEKPLEDFLKNYKNGIKILFNENEKEEEEEEIIF